VSSQRIVVVGADATGMSAASRAKRRAPEIQVEAYDLGRYVSYGACGIPYAVSGEVGRVEDLVVISPDRFREERGIEVFTRHLVERIVPAEKKILVRDLAAGRVKERAYDKLVFSTGAEPITPKGIDPGLEEVFFIRNLEDAQRLKSFLAERKPGRAVIVGAGYIGLEMAESLAKAGLRVQVTVRGERVLSSAEEEISSALAGELKRQGVELVTGAVPKATERPARGGVRLELMDGRELTADLLLVGAGVRPRSELAEEAGLKLGVKGAVAVDRLQRTSDPDIFSGGDCAEAYHRLLGRNTYVPLALGANRQGRVIGDNLVGGKSEFPGILATTVTKVFDLTAARTGLSLREAREEGLEAVKVVTKAPSRASYYPGSSPITTCLIAEKGTGRPLGAQMVGLDGVAKRIDIWGTALSAGLSLEEIGDLDLAYAPPYSPVWDPVLVTAGVALKKIS